MEQKISFSEALIALKNKRKVARLSWNGKGMYIYLVPANKYPAQRNINETVVNTFTDNMVPYTAYIAMKTVRDEITPWSPAQSDVIEEDWVIVE